LERFLRLQKKKQRNKKHLHIMDTQIEKKKVFLAASTIEYAQGGIVSKEFVKTDKGGVTLFAFDCGQRLSEHSAPFDALVQVMEGEASISIDGQEFVVSKGEMIIIPANHPHAVMAKERFKMMLTMIKG
jgi:quercetin dioxygenase-like cupin family protein